MLSNPLNLNQPHHFTPDEQHALRLAKIARIANGEQPRVLDLFAGAGGLSLGFHSAGFEIVAAVEIDEQAAKTHAINFFRESSEDVKRIHAKNRDITRVEPYDLIRDYGFQYPATAIDVIIGGPPCQAFARVGRAKLREVANHPEAFLQDPRANLYLRFIHYVEQLQPLAILMENVPDALNHGGHNIAEETCEVLSGNGHRYHCAYTMLNSAFYGVPQMRERMILIAYADELNANVVYPQPTNWIRLPGGYTGTRNVALQTVRGAQQLNFFEGQVPQNGEMAFYIPAPVATPNLTPSVTAFQALCDLPEIRALELYEQGLLKRGVQDPRTSVEYPCNVQNRDYGFLMRSWRGFSTDQTVTGHIFRYLPRDYRLFARLHPGDQYPQAYERAIDMFKEDFEIKVNAGRKISLTLEEAIPLLKKRETLPIDMKWVEDLWKKDVPPYDPSKFPNKWRKMEPDLPARTLMAHIGKDSYSHIHYDSRQARTITVREAARIMSFPDGFLFSGMMNAAFKQAGNAVPPLFAYRLASIMKQAFGQNPTPVLEG